MTATSSCATGAPASAVSVSVSKAIWSASITKHSTATISSWPIPSSSVAARLSLPFTTLLNVARLPSSSSSRLTSFSFRRESTTRNLPACAAAGAVSPAPTASTTLSFAAGTTAAATSPFASRASWRSALQIYSKLAASGSAELL